MKAFLAALILLGGAARAEASPAVTLQEPPERFFQSGSALEVQARVGAPGDRVRATLLVDGEPIAERVVSTGTVSFDLPLNPDVPVSLVQVCAARGGRAPACEGAHAAGMREFALLRETLEEMNEIAIAIERCSRLAIGFGGLPATLQDLAPTFLAEVPLLSPLGTPYLYLKSEGHYALRVQLPGTGQILLEDGAFTEVPRGALTDREATRLAREQLLQTALAIESYWVDYTQYPADMSELTPVYRQFLPRIDPYGHPYAFALTPQTYTLIGYGRDGAPGGSGFDADTRVEEGQVLAQTTPYRGRQEYARYTVLDMTNIATALTYYRDVHGHWPGTLPQLQEDGDFQSFREFTDFCGNPYVYQVHDVGLGHFAYTLRAYGCDGVPGTDLEESWLYFFAANDEGNISMPRTGWPWPGLFD